MTEKKPAYFVVEGDPNLKFAWEIKARQKGFEYERLEEYGNDFESEFETWSDKQVAAYEREIELLEAEMEAIYETA